MVNNGVNTMTKRRSGIGVGIISRGNVSIKWMMQMEKVMKHLPIGMFWKYIIVEGMGYSDGRIEVVRQAQQENLEWLMFIDDDVFLPEDAIQTLVSRKKDIITGIYWVKSPIETPVIFEREGAGPMFDFPIDKVFEIAGGGLGCTLINMKVFDEFDKNNQLYFQENWIMESDDGRRMKCPIGEDHYFFHFARKFGFKVWCDSGILCEHYDAQNKIFYPHEDVVRRICEQKLREVGREDLIKDAKSAIGEDPLKKNVVLFNYTAVQFDGDELIKRGVGGTETSIINLAREFSRSGKYNVHVFCNCVTPGLYDGVYYHHAKTSLSALPRLKPELLIMVRNMDINGITDFKGYFNSEKTVFWMHDMPTEDDEFVQKASKFDKLVVLSEFHKGEYKKLFPELNDEQFVVIGNGIDKHLFSQKLEKIPGQLIYSSTPYRGLEVLASVFPQIKARVPHATLKVFSSMKTYSGDFSDERFESLYEKLRQMPGVTYAGSVKQDLLAKEMSQSEVLAYPNIFPETYCISVDEAQHAGTFVVTSKFGALPEHVTYGKLIEGNPFSEEYKSAFVDAVVDALTTKQPCTVMVSSWGDRLREWEKVFLNTNINTPSYWDDVYKRENDMGYVRHDAVRTQYILDRIKDGDVVWDIGCGVGSLTREIKSTYPKCEVWGSDFSNYAIDLCRQKSKNIFYTNHPLMNLEFEKNYFDVITIMHVLEHVEDPREMILRVKNLLKKGGKILVGLPINDDDWKEHLKIWQDKDVRELFDSLGCDYECTYTGEKSEDGRILAHATSGRPMEQALITITFKE